MDQSMDCREELHKGSHKAQGRGWYVLLVPCLCQVCCPRSAQAPEKEFPWHKNWEHLNGMVV